MLIAVAFAAGIATTTPSAFAKKAIRHAEPFAVALGAADGKPRAAEPLRFRGCMPS